MRTNQRLGALTMMLCLAACGAEGDATSDTDDGTGSVETSSSTDPGTSSTTTTGESTGETAPPSTTADPTTTGETDPPGTETGSEEETGDSTGIDAELQRVALELEGVESLAGGFHFELWALIDDAPVTVGKFNVDASAAIVDLDGIAIEDGIFDAGRDLSVATDFVITIEAAGDVDIIPGASKYMSGPLSDGAVSLTTDDERSLGDDFSEASGYYILATPTDGPDSNEAAGVWWLDLSVEPAAPGLNLPELPEGWEYEGWAVIGGSPISTGRFLDPAMSDFAGEFSGNMPGPNVPGEDFLVNAPEGQSFPADLRGETIVITVEPEPDDSPAPFTLKPLASMVNEAAATHQSMTMDLQLDGFPTGSVELLE